MRVLFIQLLVLLVAAVHGWAPASHVRAPTSFLGSSLFLSSSSSTEPPTEDYDDWYADFDPSEYEHLDNTNTNNRGSSGNSRGGGGNHDYTRDTQADNSNLDVEAVDRLLSERLEYRKTGRYNEADDVRDVLLSEHGVAVFDREKTWRSGCSTGGSGMKWRPNNNNNNNRRGAPPRQRNFGPNGHDYELASDAGPNTSSLSDKEIHALLAERLEYKMSRQFQDADAIQDELIQAGVHVHDGSKEWRADGERFSSGNNGDRGMRNSDRGGGGGRFNQAYQQSSHSLAAENDEEIQDLVDQRMDAKRVRDYHVADELRDVLRAEYNVEVNDKLRQWSVGGDFGIPTRDRNYSMSPDSEIPDNANEIQQLVDERNEARKVRDFDTADAIRDDLLDQNIMVDDKLSQWAVGGRFSQGNNGRLPPNSPFTKRGAGGDLTEEQEALVIELIQERSAAQREKQFGKADRIRDKLQADFQVRVDDRSREWHVVSEKYANMSPFDLNEDDQTLIEEKIVQRAVAKLEKDYDTADAIRDELAETYNVDIDDRLREWRVIGTSDGPPPASSAMGDVDDSDFEEDESDFENEQDVEEDVDSNVEMETESDEADLTSLTIPELKIRLKEAGLPVSGRKSELIERLTS